MNLAFYAPGWPAATAQNGIATYVETMVDALRARGHRCFIILPAYYKGETTQEIIRTDWSLLTRADRLRTAIAARAAQFTQGKRMSFLRAGVALGKTVRRLHEEVGLDILEMEETHGLAGAVQEAVDFPVVTRLHGPAFRTSASAPSLAQRGRIAAEGRSLKKIDAITCPSRGVLRDAISHYGLRPRHAATIPNPIAIPPAALRWRADDHDGNMLLFVGRFDETKGADIALEAFARLAVKYPELRLVMAGDDRGLPLAGGASAGFEEYVRTRYGAGLRARIDFRGRIPRAEVEALMRECVAYVSTSRLECFAYTVAEALAVGCPVVASRTYGAAEELVDGEEILLADIEDAEGVAAQVGRLVEDANLRRRVAAAGRAAAERLLSLDRIVDDTLAFYARVQAGRARQ
ncbi:glycosyltransferase family 4 protein [Amphiplicatus metriothermophilus]|nr:glycosyltransferase family 4 protein [Amphiplicatus metriothermophilus]MBB5519548.1 glycosyltransferase involved in cell wall biosynthesis [Amphiplicatus metriothermophilus]